jgi:type IV secretory pathway TraG/TraD family ATPase VirD4
MATGWQDHGCGFARNILGRPIGIPWTADAGHIAVVGPTRSGKGLHLTDTLIRWPGPVVCIDPKGEQWQRTASFRQRAYGPVFRIPPLSILSNCTSQLFFPPRDPHTAELISRSFGSRLEVT